MADVPNDVVELIIAVDLNPSDPEEPLNVRDVKVGEQVEDGDCRMCKKILDAIAKIDPDLEAAVDGKSVEEAVSALEAMADDAPEEAREEADMFDKAMDAKPEREAPRRPEGGGGFKAAADRAFGKKRDEDKEED